MLQIYSRLYNYPVTSEKYFKKSYKFFFERTKLVEVIFLKIVSRKIIIIIILIIVYLIW